MLTIDYCLYEMQLWLYILGALVQINFYTENYVDIL